MNQLLGMVLAGMIGLGLLSQVLPETAALSSQASANYAAAQLHTFTKAADNYIDNNYATLVAATAGGVQAVTAPMIVTEGSLDPSFVDTNIFDQTHRLLIRQPSPGTLEGLVATCGGDTIEANELARISQLAGPDAGLISPLDINNALGAGGHWTMALANYVHASCALTVGHLTSLITASAASDVSPYLHRNAHADPAANSMFTNLLMEGNNIVNAGNLDVDSIDNASGNVRINDALEVTGTLSNPTGTLRIDDTLEITGAISDPTGHLTIQDSVDLQSDLYVNRVIDRNNNGFIVDPASVSQMNDVRASILRDRDNTGYYLDLNNTSNANHMNAQRLYSWGDTYSNTFRPRVRYAENSACSQANGIGVSTATNIIICRGGIWRVVGGQRLQAGLTSIPVNSNYTIPADGFVYVQSNSGCSHSYQLIYINNVTRANLKSYVPGGSSGYGTFPVRAGDIFRAANYVGCNPDFIYYQRYG
jgi:hypothetical protein|tara:strand:- start:7994 stop:9427 length:1434 start_codon:yes stop_codon:yes gene_type:complete